MELTRNGKFLIVTLLFRLFFGGYLTGMDQYLFNDFESALTVVLVYILIVMFAKLFSLDKRYGLIGIIGFDSMFISLQSIFIIGNIRTNSQSRVA